MDEQSTESSAIADTDLVLRTRSGDADAFGELWRRHYRSGVTVARSVTSSIDPDDLVQESYARIYQAILKGGGPNGSFRAYLFTSIRNTAAAWGRARRDTAIDELETVADPSSTEAAIDEELDRGLTAQAFRSLPSRWQEVLWYSEIEQMKPATIGGLLGMSAGAVSQLSFRAREGLREAWIQAHLRSVAEDSECRWTIDQLGAHSRGNLGVRAQQRVDRHLQECTRCMIVAAEAKDVSSRLALVLLPLVLGVSGASGYLATLQGGGAPIVALAAMPSSVIEGAVVVTSGSGAATGAAFSSSTARGTGSGPAGSGAAGGSGTAGGSGGSGAMTGIGALVGAGSAALVVAGVVAAAAVVPGMMNGAPATSQPSASESEPSSISSEVMPGTELSADQPMVIEIDDDTQASPPEADVIEPTPPQSADVVAPPAVQPEPTPAPELNPKPEPTPGPGTGTDDPGTEEPGAGTEEPGTEEPGTEEPGTENPDPGTGEPGTEEPGTEEPGTEDPGTENPDPGVTPVELTWGPATVQFEGVLFTDLLVPVSGTPGATVQVRIGPDRVLEPIVLGEDGKGTARLRATLLDQLADAHVGFRYVIDGDDGVWSTTPLSSLYNVRTVAVPTEPEGAATVDSASDATAAQEAAPTASAPQDAIPDSVPAAPETPTPEQAKAAAPAIGQTASEQATPTHPASEPTVLEPTVLMPPAPEQTAPDQTAPEQTAPADPAPADPTVSAE